jgi:hypothetical protein
VKSEWEFQFETRGFRFDREYKYKALPDVAVRFGGRPPEHVEPLIRIVPKDIEPPPYIDQVGSLHVLLPYSQSETRAFAFLIAKVVADRITFQQGDFRLVSGLIVCKRIAETAEEEAEFGEALYNVELNLIEVLPTPAFESALLAKTPNSPKHVELIAQFNETKRDKSVVRQFLGYFKILESIAHSEGTGPGSMKQVLLRNARLRQIYDSGVTGGTFEDLVSKLVDVRHRCAHLKLHSNFGYSPVDQAIGIEVAPLLPVLATLAHYLIMGHEQE